MLHGGEGDAWGLSGVGGRRSFWLSVGVGQPWCRVRLGHNFGVTRLDRLAIRSAQAHLARMTDSIQRYGYAVEGRNRIDRELCEGEWLPSASRTV